MTAGCRYTLRSWNTPTQMVTRRDILPGIPAPGVSVAEVYVNAVSRCRRATRAGLEEGADSLGVLAGYAP